MELTLKRLLEQAEFTKKRGAYDVVEVDDFLDRAVAMAAKVEARLNQALEEAAAATAGGPTGPSHAEVEAEVERRVLVRLAEMPAEPAAVTVVGGPSDEEVAEEARRTLLLAQRTADAAVKEAREDAAKLLAEAQAQAETARAEAEDVVNRSKAEIASEAAAERAAARDRLATEVRDVEAARDALRADVDALDRHIDAQRAQLQAAITDLQRVLDDPSGFRAAPAPKLNDPEVPRVAERDPEAPAPAPAPTVRGPLAPATSTAGPSVVIEADHAGPEPLTFDEVDHAVPGVIDPPDSGPPTAPVTAIDLDAGPADRGRSAGDAPSAQDEDDAFLAELRKAMADGEPLGPRDAATPGTLGNIFDDDERRNRRFGRRR